jgi:hypothetical protein
MIFSKSMGANAHRGIKLKPVPRELSDDDLGVIVEAAQRRAALMRELRAALVTGNDALALKLARRATGLEEAAL